MGECVALRSLAAPLYLSFPWAAGGDAVSASDAEARTIPIPPELVGLLRAHIERYGTTTDGPVF